MLRGLLLPLCRSPAKALEQCHAAAAFGCVPRGQRAPLEADMYVVIVPSTCLVEPSLLSSRVCAVLQQAHSATSPRSPLTTARREALSDGLVVVVRAARSKLLCLNCFNSAVVVVLHSLLRAPLCSRCFAFFPLLEVLSIVPGEWLTPKMAARRCLLMI